MTTVDYLTEDNLLPSDQKYVCMSFLKPTKDDKTTLSGIKIRGVFGEYEPACAHAKKLQDIDPYHHVFVGEMGKWLPYDPDPESKYVKDYVYANEQLNGMMKSYMENQEKAKLFHEQRKNEMVRENLINNMTNQQDTMKELSDKLKNETDVKEQHSIEETMKNLEDKINKMELKKKDVEGQLDVLSKKLQN